MYRVKRRQDLSTKPETKRLRQGTEPKTERDKRLSAMEWRRIIRSVDNEEKGEEEIVPLAKALAHKYRVGDSNLPANAEHLYEGMSW